MYVMVSDGQGKLLASLRLLPTTGPHMISDVFPDVVGHHIIRHPLVIEISRMCVDTKAANAYAKSGVNKVTRELLYGAWKTAYDGGMTNTVAIFDVYVERILRRAGLVFDRLAPPVEKDDGLRTVGALFEVSPQILSNLYEEPIETQMDRKNERMPELAA